MTQGVICIAGAHRSGTSMLTRLLQRCGLHLGLEKDLMPAAADNPDGFWENLRFVQLNDEILNAVGAAWDLPPDPNQNFLAEDLEPARCKARLVIDGFAGLPAWGWKDPRNCLTWPFWQNLLPKLRTIIIVRNPLEVAYSMNKRNGTSFALGLRLWEIYNRRLLQHSDPSARIITDYRNFFENPVEQLRRLVSFADLAAAEVPAAAALVANNRRHTSFTIEQLIDAGVSAQIITLYRSLTAESAAGENPEPNKLGSTTRRKSEPARDQTDPLAGAGSHLNFAVPAAEDIRQELAWRRGTEIEQRSKIEAMTGEAQRLALEIGRRDGRIMEIQTAYAHLDQLLQREYAGRDKLLAELEKTRTQLTEQAIHLADQARILAERENLRERFVQTNRLLHTQSIRLAEQESRGASLTERLRKQLRETKRLLRWLDEIEGAAEKLRGSRRWILANPGKWLIAKISGRRLAGFGHLDKNVERYRAWRSDHPDFAQLDDEIAALTPRETSAALPSPTAGMTSEPNSFSEATTAKPARPIQFSRPENAEVTIVIPVFNQMHFTQACLASLQEHSDNVACEVLVVDDCSTDATSEMIGRIPGIVYLRNESNLGFIASCNRGAKAARGKYLVFLNNDTTVTEGWLASLLETFQLEPDAGLVGSKLIYPDGRLQEAGGIVWQDGSAWNRGKFQDPRDPEYNYLRTVDYCSAASVMVPKSLFESVGGFDPRYSPGYYEDTDLAFQIRRRGRQVFYQPLSEVIHFEGATGGTDISAGAKKHQEINRSTFVARWAEELSTRPANGDAKAWDASPIGRKHILVIDHHLPMTDRDAGSVRMFHILTILHELGHKVTFLPDNIADIPPYGDELRKRGIEVIHHPYCKSVRHYLETHGAGLNIVVLSRCDFARKHIADVRHYAPQSRIIFDTVDLHHLRASREAALTDDPDLRARAEEKKLQEYELIDEADQTWVVSSFEQALLQKDRPGKSIQTIPTIVDVPGSNTPFALRHDFLFIGSFQHTPNVDAVLFFTNQVFPLVTTRLPGVKFYIIGDKAPPEVIALASEQIIITGLQPDVRPYFESVRLSVAPLRFGAGVKGKINQSMGFGVPVVATSLAVEGMGITNRREVMIANRPETFAEAVAELYHSEPLWNELSEVGLKYTQRHYSKKSAETKLALLFGRSKANSTITHDKNPSYASSER